jgi:hypothetical protein
MYDTPITPVPGEEPSLGDLLIELASKQLLVVQHVSDGWMVDGVVRWYVNDFQTGRAAGTITLQEWKKGALYRYLGKLDESAWRAIVPLKV